MKLQDNSQDDVQDGTDWASLGNQASSSTGGRGSGVKRRGSWGGGRGAKRFKRARAGTNTKKSPRKRTQTTARGRGRGRGNKSSTLTRGRFVPCSL